MPPSPASLQFSLLHGDFSMVAITVIAASWWPPSTGFPQLFFPPRPWGFLHDGHQSWHGLDATISCVPPTSPCFMGISPQWPPESWWGLGGTIPGVPSASPCSMGVTPQWPPASCWGLLGTKLPNWLQGHGDFSTMATRVMPGS